MLLFSKKSDQAEGGDRASRLRLLIIIGGALLGVILLLFGSGAFHSNTKEEEQEVSTVPFSESELRQYQSHLEGRIKALCESVSGVGSVNVIVTLESGFEDIYATEQKDGDEQYVIIGSGSNASALFLTRAMPQICGIGVVCTGGNQAYVKNELIALLSATFHIPTNRIYVTGSHG